MNYSEEKLEEIEKHLREIVDFIDSLKTIFSVMFFIGAIYGLLDSSANIFVKGGCLIWVAVCVIRTVKFFKFL